MFNQIGLKLIENFSASISNLPGKYLKLRFTILILEHYLYRPSYPEMKMSFLLTCIIAFLVWPVKVLKLLQCYATDELHQCGGSR